jgi:23S rRNA pseudouridine2457 synthase
MKSYILFFKPYGVLSQFTSKDGHPSLADFSPFPHKNIYAAGRLDADSEGLLFLTDDTSVNHKLTDPKFGHKRTYLVQVEGLPDDEDIRLLENGIVIEGKMTKQAEVHKIDSEPDFPPRNPPIRFRKNIPTKWLEITLQEGRNRQVRKMTAAAGHPTLRLIRTAISFLTLDSLKPGEHRELTSDEIIKLKTLLK